MGGNNSGQSTVPAGLSGLLTVAAGGNHSLALKNDGSVVAWGDNSVGQTAVPAGLSGVIAISAGYAHSLALKSDGMVVAWGQNASGQTTVPAGLSGVIAISAGHGHSLALKSDGTLVAWGNNGSGQLGVPAGLTNVVAIAAGGAHSLALKSDGTVVAWGANYYGQSTVLAGLSGVTAIAAGYAHSVALKNNGTVVAWGANYGGQIAVPSGLIGVSAIAAGDQHNLVLKSDGTLVAWGNNSYGQGVIPAGLSGLIGISAGSYHNLAMSASYGRAITVLEDSGPATFTNAVTNISPGPAGEAAQLVSFLVTNNNNALFSTQPAIEPNGTLTFTPAANVNGTATVTVYAQDDGGTASGGVDTSAAQTFTLTVTAVNDAPSVNFASSSVARLQNSGASSVSGFASFSPGPANESAQTVSVVSVTAANDAIFSVPPALSASGTLTFTLAANTSGSSLVTVIVMDSGGTANGGVDKATNTFTILIAAVNQPPNFTLAMGNLITNGTVAAWGKNSAGQTEVPAGLTGAVAISAGNRHNVVLRNDGAVFAWGENVYGQTNVPVGLSNVVAVSACYHHSLLLKSDGTVVAWGDNTYGESNVPAGLSGVAAVSAGHDHNLVLKRDGTLVAWGKNDSGQAGVSSGLSNVIAISAGGAHNLALKSDGTVVTWGDNTHSQSTPPAGLSGIINVAAGMFHSLALTGTMTRTVTVLEDTAAFTQANAVTNVSSGGPASESAQTVTFIVTNNNAALFNTPPAISPGGTLTFTPAANANGSATITVIALDNGGTANGGVDTQTQTFALAITAVNDAPVITLTTNLVYAPPAAGTQSLAGFATFSPAANASGSATVTLIAQDNGGTANGGVDKSTNTFTLAVALPNRAPSVAFATNNLVRLEDSGAASVSSFATFGPGSGTDSTQTVSVVSVTAATTPLFSAQPALAANGTLTFTPAANANGTSLVTVIVQDNGGTADGGVDRATNTFTITVTAVNDAPIFALPGGLPTAAGAIWTARENSRQWQSVASSADGSKLVAAVPGGMIYTSTDSGATWTPRESNRQWLSVASSADGVKLAAVSTAAGLIYTSTDSGVSWTPRASNRDWVAIASSADGAKLVAVAYNGQIFTSSDSGASWTARESSRKWASVASSADGVTLIAGTENAQLYVSSDSGASWTPRATPNFWRAVAASADGTKLVAAVYGGQIYTSGDSGASWTPRENNRNWVGLTSSADGTKLLGAVYTGQLYVSTDAGTTWTARESSRTWYAVAGSQDGGKLIAVVQNGQIYTSVGSALPYPLTVLEDSGAFSTNTFATSISAGPADESAQVVSFTVNNDNSGLFSSQPAIAANGTLTFTPAANANGSSLVTVIVQDNGGTANGGVDRATNTFTITVTPVNDAPGFALYGSGAAAGAATTLVHWGATYPMPDISGGIVGLSVNTYGSFNMALKAEGTIAAWGSGGSHSNLTGVAMIAAGGGHNLALQSNGTVVAWGLDGFGQAMVPEGLTGVVAIAAGDRHSLALKSDGTVVGWGAGGPGGIGSQNQGQSTIPEGLTGVIAIAAGLEHSLALKANGTVVAWGYNGYGQTAVPTGLTNVVAIAVGWEHSVAVRSDGTVVSWGRYDQATVPVGLTGVVAIAAGNGHSLALKNDRTVVGWGENYYGQATVPSGLMGVRLIAAGGRFSLAAYSTNSSSQSLALTVAEDSGAQTVTQSLVNISAGPADEAGQVVSFIVTNDNNALFSTQPAISTNGTLTFTPAANAFGSATVTVVVRDNGGVDTSAPQTFTITVTPVNDPPTLGVVGDLALASSASPGPVTVNLSGISAGPGETAQLAVSASSSDPSRVPHPTVSYTSPSATGTLSFTPVANATGTVVITVTVQEDNDANGTYDASFSRAFNVTFGTAPVFPAEIRLTGTGVGNIARPPAQPWVAVPGYAGEFTVEPAIGSGRSLTSGSATVRR